MNFSISICSLCLILIVNVYSVNAQNRKDRLISHNPDSAINIGEVRISAYRINNPARTTPGSIAVLSSQELTVSPASDMTVLNTLPGVYMQSGTLTTSRIVIRGMGSRTPYNTNRIKAYLNNIPLTTADGIFAPDETDIFSLGKIEVIKGPSSALYGSGLGGSINMYTPLHSKNSLQSGFQYGSFNTGRYNISGTSKKENLVAWGSLSQVGSSGYRENNFYRRTSGLSTLRWEHTGWSLNSTLLLTGVNAGIPSSIGLTQFETAPQTAASNWLAVKGYKKYLKGIGALSLRNNFSSVFSGEAILFGKWNNDFERRPFNDLDDGSSGGGLRYELRYQTKAFQWISGTEILTEKYGWKLKKDTALLNSNIEKRQQYSFFSMIDLKRGKWNLTVAAAINSISYQLTDKYLRDGNQSGRHKFNPIFSPRIGFNYAAGPDLNIYASAGHGFSMPSTEETLLPQGTVNTGIKPENGFQYETGVRINYPRSGWEADASVYLINLNNLLVTKRVTEDIFTGINAGKTRHFGFELLVKGSLFDSGKFPGKATSSLSYSWSLNKFIDFTDNGISHDGKLLPGIPDQLLNLNFNWLIFGSLNINPLIQYTGYQYLTDDNSLKYPGYLLAGVRMSGDFSLGNTGFTGFWGINNLTGRKYASMLIVNALPSAGGEPRYYYPGLPRNFYFGISLKM